jgi:hypothetical protein
MEGGLLKDLMLVLFATTAGFTASGIVANIYRLLAKKPQTMGARAGYVAVMIVAGPNVLFENATTSFRKKGCSKIAYWLAASVTAYWSFLIGLFVMDISLVF